MTTAERYQKLAAQLRAKARKEQNQHVKSEFESLAECYSLLAKRTQRPAVNETDSSLPTAP